MTVTYSAQVASCKRFGCFWKLLLRWKGSIYKLLWPNLFVYVMLYSTLSITYRYLLNETQKTTFEKLSLHCQTYGDLIPVSFVLGFYVSIVIKRWWDQYTSIPWPDPLAVLVSAFVTGEVVTLAVFTYFMASLMGNQYLNPKKGYPTHTIDLVVPIFTLLQFFFYMGWLMVAETLVNPFGEDDDDFEANWLIDRNLQISYLIVDEVHEDHPALVKDQYWEEVFPTELPYTEAAKQFYIEPFLGSAQAVDVPLHQRGMVLMPISVDAEFTVKNMECGPTNPLQIKSIFSLKTKSSSFPSASRKSSTKSVLGMIRKNIYEDYLNLSKKKSEEMAGKLCNNSLSIASKSQLQSINSTSRNNFNDFQEDIFRMSDFSMADSLERTQSCLKTSITTIRKGKRNFGSAQV